MRKKREERQEQLERVKKIINDLNKEAKDIDEPRLKKELLYIAQSLESWGGLFERFYLDEIRVAVIPVDKVKDIYNL